MAQTAHSTEKKHKETTGDALVLLVERGGHAI